MKRICRTFFLILSGIFAALLLAACSLILKTGNDSHNATLTALITPTAMAPTLDLKGNKALEPQACEVTEVVSIGTFEDAEEGGIFAWANQKNLFAYVAPENRYWAWFSGAAVFLDFSENPYEAKEIYATSNVKVFGDFAFSPDDTKVAFVAFRPSEKIYTVMVAWLNNPSKQLLDLFPGAKAETDEYSGSKSVIGWVNNAQVRVSASCGIDCENIALADISNGALSYEDQTRKYGHDGRSFERNVIKYDDRDYPAMLSPNWSPDLRYIYYEDTQKKSWIVNDVDKEQFELPLEGKKARQSLWSHDSQYIALRFEEKIRIFKINCMGE